MIIYLLQKLIPMAFQMKINGVESISKMLKSPVRKVFALCTVLHVLSIRLIGGGWRQGCLGRGARAFQLRDHLCFLDFCKRDD